MSLISLKNSADMVKVHVKILGRELDESVTARWTTYIHIVQLIFYPEPG